MKKYLFPLSLSTIIIILLIGLSIVSLGQFIKKDVFAATTLAITSPENNSMVKGTVNITINAPSSLKKVDLHFTQLANLIEFTYGANQSGDNNWTYRWNTTDYNDSTYQIYAAAVDADGNSSISPFITVNVANESNIPPNEPDTNINSAPSNTNNSNINLNTNINENQNNNINTNLNQNTNQPANTNSNVNLNLNVNSATNTNTNINVNINNSNVNGNQNINANINATTDSDQDGLPDNEEKLNKTDPNNPDTDGDGLTDGFEIKHGFNPLKPDNATPSRQPDQSIIKLIQEAKSNSKTSLDSDHDGIPDSVEETIGSNPFQVSTANDGLTDLWKVQNGYNPQDDATQDIVKKVEEPAAPKKTGISFGSIALTLGISIGIILVFVSLGLRKRE